LWPSRYRQPLPRPSRPERPQDAEPADYLVFMVAMRPAWAGPKKGARHRPRQDQGLPVII
jgi:hypothetical protein